MKITKAEMRTDDGWLRCFVTIDGVEWLMPGAKDIMLAQGVTLPPEDWPYPLEERYIFTDLSDEDSPTEILAVIVDPVLVGLAIRASRQQADGPIANPCEGEGLAAIRLMCKHQKRRYSTARPDSA